MDILFYRILSHDIQHQTHAWGRDGVITSKPKDNQMPEVKRRRTKSTNIAPGGCQLRVLIHNEVGEKDDIHLRV